MAKKSAATAVAPVEAPAAPVEDNPLASLMGALDAEADGVQFTPQDRPPEGFTEPAPEPEQPEATPAASQAPAQTPDPEPEPEGEPEGEEEDDTPVFTKADMAKALALQNFSPADLTSQPAQPEPQAAVPPTVAAPAPQESVQRYTPVQVPVLDDDVFTEVMTDPVAFQQYMGQTYLAAKQAAMLEIMQSLPSLIREHNEDERVLNQFREEHPEIKGQEALLTKAILAARAKHPTITTREGIMEKAAEELSFLPSLRRDIQRTIATGKKVDVIPKAVARAGVPGGRGRVPAPGDEPQKQYNPIEEFKALGDYL